MSENLYDRVQREAGERLAALLALPDPETEDDIGCKGTFNPWDLLPAVYGTYSSEFDRLAIDVLTDIADVEVRRSDLASEMFREMLCKVELCDYGTSPRVCFPSEQFRKLLPELILRWKAYAAVQWGEPTAQTPR